MVREAWKFGRWVFRFLSTNKLGWVCDELNVGGGSLSSYNIRCDKLNVRGEFFGSCWIPHRCVEHTRSGMPKEDLFTTGHAIACLSCAVA